VPTELHKLGRQVDIRVRVQEEDRSRLEDIRNLTVARVDDRPITLEAVADLVIEQGPSEIRRVDQERVAVVSAGLNGIDLGEALSRIDVALADISLRRRFRSVSRPGAGNEPLGGQYGVRFRAGCVLVYLVMASQFESLLHPLVIMLTIPFGMVGVAWSLWLTSGVISVVPSSEW